jgi:myo-inositol-1-phosphate synthase
MLKAPLVKPGTYMFHDNNPSPSNLFLLGAEVVNSLNRQRNALESFLKACVGLEANSDMLLETRIW